MAEELPPGGKADPACSGHPVEEAGDTVEGVISAAGQPGTATGFSLIPAPEHMEHLRACPARRARGPWGSHPGLSLDSVTSDSAHGGQGEDSGVCVRD